MFEGLPEATELDVERVEAFVNRRFQLQSPSFTLFRDIDARFLSWKGGALLASFDTSDDLWIKNTEWNSLGFRAVREKAPFPWH